MSKLADLQAAGNVLTQISAGDLIYVSKLGVDDYVIEGSAFNTYINSLITTSVKTYISDSINTGNSQTYGLGAVADYTGFSVKLKIKIGTDLYVLNFDFDYHDSDANYYFLNASRRLPSGLTFDALESAGQFYFEITNSTGSTINIQYRITEKIPA